MRTRLLALLRWALFSVVAGVVLLEVVLRIAGYTYSPLALIRLDERKNPTPAGTASREPLTVFDPELLWVLNPRASAALAVDGTRGGPLAEARAQAQKLIVAVGDSNTLGAVDGDHWPGYLQDLIDLNAPAGTWRVVNAGVLGYASFQGLRRARQVLGHRPDVVYFSFGANDGYPMRRTDEDYARRAERLASWRWLRLAPPLMHAWWRARDRDASGAPLTHRVPLADYRRNLEELVRLCRDAGTRPVILTRPYRGESIAPDHWLARAALYNQATRDVAARGGVDLVDVYEAFRGAPELFTDESHFNTRGHQRMARDLLADLHARGLVGTGFVYRSAIHPGLSAPLPELLSGWHAAEDWPNAPSGRWTARDASAILERRGREASLEVDLELFRSTNRTTGRIEAAGRTILRIDHPNGRLRRALDVSGIADRRIEIRLVVDETAREGSDTRDLGLFVHSLALRPVTVRPGELEDGRQELGAGFWAPETWANGSSGRWTKNEGVLRLARPAGEDRLVVEFSLDSPRGETAGSLEVNGRRLASFRAPNGPRVEWLDIGGIPGDEIVLRIRVDAPFVPRLVDERSGDGRSLGVFVHEVRLEHAAPAGR